MKNRIAVILAPGVFEFSGYFFRAKKLIRLIRTLGNSEVVTIVLVDAKKVASADAERLESDYSCSVLLLSPMKIFSIKKVLSGNGLILGENLIPTFWAVALSWLFRFSSKIIFDYHGVAPEENLLIHKSKLRYWIYKIIESITVRRSHSMLVVSEFFYDYLISKYPMVTHSICIIRNFLEYDDFVERFPLKDELRRNLDLPEKKILAIYAGNFQQWQEHEHLFSIAKVVFNNSDSIRLVVLTDEKDPAIIGRLRNLGVIVREVAHRDVFSYLLACNIGILLRRDILVNQVADPTKLGEYLACGLYLFCSGLGDVRMWLQEQKIGVYLKNNELSTESMASRLLQLSNQINLSEYNFESTKIAQTYYTETTARTVLRDCLSSL